MEAITREEMLMDGQTLEPITRKEKILAGEDLDPITREEYFLKEYRGGGGDITVESLNVTENGTYQEEGKAYSPVVVNVPTPENSYQLKSIENTPTAIATFNASALPMPSLSVGIEAVQSGTGAPSPTNIRPISGWSAVNVTRSRNNLLDISNIYLSGYGINSEGEIVASENYNVYRLRADDNTSYTVAINDTMGAQNRGLRLAFYSENNELISIGGGQYQPVGERVTVTIQGESGVEYLYISIRNSAYDIQLEIGDTATTYEAFSGTTYTTALKDENDQPLECYGGELSNVNGVQTLTVTHANIASYNGETINEPWISSMDVYSEGATPTTGAQVVYPLATPVETPQQSQAISTQDGTNNLWADCGDVISGEYFEAL